MSKKAWLYFFIMVLAAGAVIGGRVWVEKKSITPHLTSPLDPSPGSAVAEPSSPARGEEGTLPPQILLDVPFTAQAPLRKWSDPRQQDACEEASILMAAHWIKGEPFASAQAAKEKILALSKYQEENYGYYQDTSAADTAKLFKEYFGYVASVSYDIDADVIKKELAAGHLVIVPANGRKLNNPYFTQPGPERHMLVIIGYDDSTGEFITNDPGIMRGKSYRYPQKTVISALRDYPSGYHEPLTETRTAMIVVIK